MNGGVVLSWSGGKDSALALWTLREELGVEPAALLTTINEDFDRISIHGVRRELLHAQAEAVGLPLVEVGIPTECSNELYEERMAAALASPPLAEVGTFAFADLFLADIRAYREERLARVGREAIFPLWGRDTAALGGRFIAAGFAATLVVVDTDQLDRALPAGATTRPCCRISPRESTPAVRTASSTPSSTPPIFSRRRSRCSRASATSTGGSSTGT